jgi:hypothetical protein
MTTLAAFLLSITGTLAARVLFSLGFGLFSYAALTTLASSVITTAQTYYGQVDTTVLQLINLGGIGQFLGILSAALITKASLAAIKRLRPV